MNRRALLALTVLGLAVLPTASSAGELSPSGGGGAGSVSAGSAATASSGDAQVDRLKAAGRSVKFNYVPEGQKERYGHAEVLVHAPLETVRAIVQDYKHYQEYAPEKFKTARVVGRDKAQGTTDVYIQVPILKGMATMWSKLRFERPHTEGAQEIVEGKFLEGSVDNMHLVFRMRKIDEQTTVLATDVLIVPKFPAPQSAIDEALRDAAVRTVDAVEKRSEHPQ